jgi:dipeptidyl aminopeptidase/acylaminoacyl peptidase
LDKSKIHIYGGSYGGYSGGILGSRFSQYFKSTIILNGVLSIPGQLFFTDIPEWCTV